MRALATAVEADPPHDLVTIELFNGPGTLLVARAIAHGASDQLGLALLLSLFQQVWIEDERGAIVEVLKDNAGTLS